MIAVDLDVGDKITIGDLDYDIITITRPGAYIISADDSSSIVIRRDSRTTATNDNFPPCARRVYSEQLFWYDGRSFPDKRSWLNYISKIDSQGAILDLREAQPAKPRSSKFIWSRVAIKPSNQPSARQRQYQKRKMRLHNM